MAVSGHQTTDFKVGQDLVICGPAFNWPLGLIVKVKGFHSENGHSFILVSPIQGGGGVNGFGVPASSLEFHRCQQCPHKIDPYGRFQEVAQRLP
jgi:hypothetical protein